MSSKGSKSPPPAVPSAAAGLDSQQENASTAAVAAIPSAAAVTQNSEAPSQQAPQERTAHRRSHKVPHTHRKQSKRHSLPQRGISSVSSLSPAVTPAYDLGIGTQEAKMKEGDVKQEVAASAPQSSASPSALKTADSASPPKVKQPVRLPDTDFLKALASLAPSPEEESARRASSLKGSRSFQGVGEEPPSSSDHSRGSYAFRQFKLSREAKLALTALLVLTALALGFLLYRRASRQTAAHCRTSCCEQHRYRISNQLDQGIDPCNDFGDYVCGRWMPRKMFRLSNSEMSDMLLSWLYNFPERLNKGFAQLAIVRKVVAMYNMCLRTKGSPIEIIKEFMHARGISWPEKPHEPVSPIRVLFDLSLNWNVHLWFTTKIFPATSTETPRHIFFAPNELMPLWKSMFSQIPKETFQTVYNELFRIFSNDTSSEPDGESMGQTYRMLEDVFNILVPACPCKARISKLFSIKDLDSNSTGSIGSHMVKVLNAVTAIDPPITVDDLMFVSDMSVLENILRIIKRFGDEAVLRHLSWLFVQTYGAVTYPTAVLLAIHGSRHHAREQQPRFCAGQVESSYKLLGNAIASVGLFSEKERRHINEHLAAIVEEAANKTWAVSWLDNDTKKVAVEKLKNVRTALWPSDKFLTPKTLEEVYENFTYNEPSFAEYWIETRHSQRLMYGSDAAEEEQLLGDSTRLPYVDYEQVLNRLSLSLGALAPPLYCKDGTNAMLYGGLLYFYARTLIAAIDTVGIKFTPQGEFVSSWLSDSIQDTFEERTLHCLPGNISIFPEVPAMEVAYAAFKRHHQESNSRLCEELTEEKVFFITACLAACATTPAHNIYGGDCNKAVMNFAPFAKAFDCPVGSKMNPASKCTFYD
ncbi:endothelin-converting enzyme 2-like [Dermacentor variabilis]|uniref:endothelin-converting enzyme 2-like n=1 Tax=Dermacentor variabilis TaxID=34621 RepID=UPI003F5BCA56